MAIVSSTAIKTNINRIAEAKDEIISAITEKGGTVAIGAKIEDLPECIRAIPTGGGTSGGGETAYLKIAYSAATATVIVVPGSYLTAREDMDEIECKVGDLVGIISVSSGVSAEFGCVLTYNTTAGSGLSRRYLYFYTISDVDAAINIV